jgi:hypothetical protein
MKTWVKRVWAGDFSAIPHNLDFLTSAEIAHLIDGYELTGGVTQCGAVMRHVLRRRYYRGRFRASALDLWVALFFAHRSCRHCGHAPEGAELAVLNQLAAELRPALLRLTAKQKTGIIAAMLEPPDEYR